MTLSQWALLGFVTWTLLVVVGSVGVPRIVAVLKREARPNAFNPAQPHGSERYQRSMRAHMNCVENLPLFGALVLLGSQIQVQSALFEWAALVVLPARLGQTLVHIASGSERAVLARFTLFSAQIVCFGLMILALLERALQ